MNILEWKTPAYSWRGRPYRTVTGLCRAVDRHYWRLHHVSTSVSFDKEAMTVRLRRPGGTEVIQVDSYHVARGDVNAVEPDPYYSGRPGPDAPGYPERLGGAHG